MAEPIEPEGLMPAPDEMPTPKEAPPAPDEALTGEGAGPLADESVTAEVAPLVWVSHPLLRRPVLGALIGAGIVIAALALGFWTRSLLWGVFSAGVLFLSLETFFLPCRYEAGAAELVVQKAFSKGRVAWATARRVYEDRHGLTLSPYRRRTFMEPYRSTRLLFDGGEARTIKDVVRMRCRDAEWLGPGERGGKETGR
jgi:hypothetical protein